MRLKNLERIEKEILSNALIDEAASRLLSPFSSLVDLDTNVITKPFLNVQLQQQEKKDRRQAIGINGWKKLYLPQLEKTHDENMIHNDNTNDNVNDNEFVYIYMSQQHQHNHKIHHHQLKSFVS